MNAFLATVEEQVRQAANDPSVVFKVAVLTLVAAIITPTWLAWWNSKIAKKEVRPNGGSSLKDQVTHTQDMIQRIDTKQDIQNLVLDSHSDKISEIKRVMREFRSDLDDVRSNVSLLQDAQDQRRETIRAEQKDITP